MIAPLSLSLSLSLFVPAAALVQTFCQVLAIEASSIGNHAMVAKKALGSAPSDVWRLKILEDHRSAMQSDGVFYMVSAATKDRRDNAVIYVSSWIKDMTGYEPSEFIGRDCRLLQGPGTDPATVRQIKGAMVKDVACHVLLLNYRKTGEPFWNLLLVEPLSDEAGTVVAYLGVQKDVTPFVRQALARTLKALPAASEQAMDAAMAAKLRALRAAAAAGVTGLAAGMSIPVGARVAQKQQQDISPASSGAGHLGTPSDPTSYADLLPDLFSSEPPGAIRASPPAEGTEDDGGAKDQGGRLEDEDGAGAADRGISEQPVLVSAPSLSFDGRKIDPVTIEGVSNALPPGVSLVVPDSSSSSSSSSSAEAAAAVAAAAVVVSGETGSSPSLLTTSSVAELSTGGGMPSTMTAFLPRLDSKLLNGDGLWSLGGGSGSGGSMNGGSDSGDSLTELPGSRRSKRARLDGSVDCRDGSGIAGGGPLEPSLSSIFNSIPPGVPPVVAGPLVGAGPGAGLIDSFSMPADVILKSVGIPDEGASLRSQTLGTAAAAATTGSPSTRRGRSRNSKGGSGGGNGSGGNGSGGGSSTKTGRAAKAAKKGKGGINSSKGTRDNASRQRRCGRCGQANHTARTCTSKFHVDGRTLLTNVSTCQRCGRPTHTHSIAGQCTFKTTASGARLSGPTGPDSE